MNIENEKLRAENTGILLYVKKTSSWKYISFRRLSDGNIVTACRNYLYSGSLRELYKRFKELNYEDMHFLNTLAANKMKSEDEDGIKAYEISKSLVNLLKE
jgi:hypothetical protein